MGSKPTVTVVPDPDALADAAARLIAEAAADAIEARGRFMWALAGGETPRATYARLALPPFRERVDWRRVWVFFGDERAVPPDHPDSNYRMAHETLLGMGVDGHTASLFPGSPVVREVFRAVAAVHVGAASIPQRLTLTLPVFNAAARVVFLVAGAEKAKAVKAVLGERATLPAAMVQPDHGEIVWLLDRAAAAQLAAAGRG